MDATSAIARVYGQAALVILLFCSADDPFLAGAGEHALEGRIGDALQDGSHGVPKVAGDLWMAQVIPEPLTCAIVLPVIGLVFMLRRKRIE